MKKLNPIAKALVATLGGFGAALGTALLDGSITGNETLAALGAGLVLGFATWRVPNRPVQ